MNTQSCASAQPPTKSAGARLRAGFTEVLVDRDADQVDERQREADGERREAGGRAPVGDAVDDEQEGEREQRAR